MRLHTGSFCLELKGNYFTNLFRRILLCLRFKRNDERSFFDWTCMLFAWFRGNGVYVQTLFSFSR